MVTFAHATSCELRAAQGCLNKDDVAAMTKFDASQFHRLQHIVSRSGCAHCFASNESKNLCWRWLAGLFPHTVRKKSQCCCRHRSAFLARCRPFECCHRVGLLRDPTFSRGAYGPTRRYRTRRRGLWRSGIAENDACSDSSCLLDIFRPGPVCTKPHRAAMS